MNRQIRKELRIWKNDFDKIWSKLTTFHRAALGLIIAMMIVALMRYSVLDAMQSELANTQKELDKKGVPIVVLTPDKDNEIQELKLKEESLEQSLKRIKEEESQVIRTLAPLTHEQKMKAVNETSRIISKSGLNLISLQELPPQEDYEIGGISTSVHEFVLAGQFDGILKFFKGITKYPWPYHLEKMSISTAKAEDLNFAESGRMFVLELSFTQTLFYYNYENLK